MFLITSGAYLHEEMKTEFGAIPPAFLPLGNRKLIHLQLALIKKYFPNEKIFLSVPESYSDFPKLEEVNYLFVPESLTLAESILYSLNVSSNDDDVLYILNGDTLFSELYTEIDTFSVNTENTDYDWDYIDKSNRKALTGFFSFSNRKDFIRALAISSKNFVDALRIYSKTHKIRYKTLNYWYDLGHLNSYFESRSKITSERAFNSIAVIEGVLWKTGFPEKKIRAEANWYENIPYQLRVYTPQYVGLKLLEKKVWYGIEYLPFIPLNELFVHGKLSNSFWLDKFNSLIRILDKFRTQSPYNLDVQGFCDSIYVQKTFSRISKIKANQHTFSIYESEGLHKITLECLDKISGMQTIPSILHGDFCFSNILYSGRGNQFKLIDPRGIDENGKFSITGDQKYDLAKLLHSIIGLYDYIIAGEYTIENGKIQFNTNNQIKNLQKEIIRFKYQNFSMQDLIPLVILLFVTMIPLHEDRPDRQLAFMLNAKRLYKDFL